MDEKYKQLLINGRGINYLLDTAYKILGNPIVIHGMTYNLLANTENTVKDDWLWNELISTGKFSHETVDFFNAVNFIEDVANNDEVTILKCKDIKYHRICGKLFHKDSNQMGCFTVIGCYKPFVNQDFEDIAIICEYISKEIQESEFYQKIEQLLDETLVSNIIDCHVNEEIDLQEKLEILYSGLKQNIFIAVVDISQYDYTVTQLIYFRDKFKSLQPEYKYFIYLNNIVILMSKNSLTLNIKEDMPKLKDFFAKYKIFAGVSKSFENLLDMQKFYKQALNALNYGLESKDNSYIFNWDNFLLNNILNLNKYIIDSLDYCHTHIKIIREYDMENQTDFFNLLCEYLRYAKNKELTCKSLNITPDVLDKSLEHIQKLTGIDWDNGNELLNIAISIKIIKQRV